MYTEGECKSATLVAPREGSAHFGAAPGGRWRRAGGTACAAGGSERTADAVCEGSEKDVPMNSFKV